MSEIILKRTYGRMHRPEDVTRCVSEVRVRELRWPVYNQCQKARGHGPDGLYCKQHDPERIKARREKKAAEYAAEMDRLANARKVASAQHAIDLENQRVGRRLRDNYPDLFAEILATKETR